MSQAEQVVLVLEVNLALMDHLDQLESLDLQVSEVHQELEVSLASKVLKEKEVCRAKEALQDQQDHWDL